MISFKLDRALFAAIALGAFILAVGPARAAVFSNGSFENGTVTDPFTTLYSGDNTSITAWHVGSIKDAPVASIDYISTYWQPGQGDRSIDLSGGTAPNSATLWQSFATIIGQAYKVSFLLSGNPDGVPPIKTVNVTLDTLIPTLFTDTYDTVAHGTTKLDMKWVLTTFTFVATAVEHTITFGAADHPNTYYGAAIDNVDISTVPLPPALLLFGSALVGMNWLRRRRTGRELGSTTMAARV